MPFLLLSSGCGLFKSSPEPVKIDRALIGTIDSVHEAGFVLVRLNGRMSPPPEAVLVSEGPLGKANLKLTGEKVGVFVAADLRSGSPMVNDGVYLFQKLNAEAPDADQRSGGLTYDEDPEVVEGDPTGIQ